MHERHLTENYAKKPVIAMNYPKAIKASYMRVNDKGPRPAAEIRDLWAIARNQVLAAGCVS